jgi:hypothetical protein
VQVQRSAVQVEVTSLRNKYETLQRNYNTVKRAKRKRVKGQAQAELDTAEAEARDLSKRVEALEAELRAAHGQLGDASREHRQALAQADKAKSSLERQLAALKVTPCTCVRAQRLHTAHACTLLLVACSTVSSQRLRAAAGGLNTGCAAGRSRAAQARQPARGGAAVNRA